MPKKIGLKVLLITLTVIVALGGAGVLAKNARMNRSTRSAE